MIISILEVETITSQLAFTQNYLVTPGFSFFTQLLDLFPFKTPLPWASELHLLFLALILNSNKQICKTLKPGNHES